MNKLIDLRFTIYDLRFMFFVVILFLFSCSPYPITVSKKSETEADKLLLMLKKKNETLITFKGVGKLKLWDISGSQSARVVWAGAFPGKLRIAVLNITGHPFATLASDGRRLYFVSHADREFKSVRGADPVLDRVVSVPVSSGDIFEMLSGRVPFRDYLFASTEISNGRPIIVLKTGERIVEKIYFDNGDTPEVSKVEIFEQEGVPAFCAEFEKTRDFTGYRIFSRLIISNDKGDGFSIDINRYESNAPIPASTFVLTDIE